jgi:hypothetical protein
MNPQPDQDLEFRLQKLEAEVNQTSALPSTYTAPEQLRPQTDNSQKFQSSLNQFINWFNGLSSFGKLIVIGVTTMIGFAILRTVLKLVASLISLALLGLLVYFLYKFFLARSSRPKE